MSNKGRVVTLVVKIQTDEYPKWIMDAHLHEPQNDVKVLGVAEGNLMKTIDDLEQELEDARYNAMGEDL